MFGFVTGIGAVPGTGATPRIGAGVGDTEEEAGVAPDTEGVEDMILDVYGVLNFARGATLYLVRKRGFLFCTGLCFRLSAYVPLGVTLGVCEEGV